MRNRHWIRHPSNLGITTPHLSRRAALRATVENHNANRRLAAHGAGQLGPGLLCSVIAIFHAQRCADLPVLSCVRACGADLAALGTIC